MLKIDYFGTIDDVRRLGCDAATEKLHAALLPASTQAVAAVVGAIIEGSAPHYEAAIKRVEQEGTVTTLDEMDSIKIVGDAATVDGAFTMRAFTSPPWVVAGTNQAGARGRSVEGLHPPRL